MISNSMLFGGYSNITNETIVFNYNINFPTIRNKGATYQINTYISSFTNSYITNAFLLVKSNTDIYCMLSIRESNIVVSSCSDTDSPTLYANTSYEGLYFIP